MSGLLSSFSEPHSTNSAYISLLPLATKSSGYNASQNKIRDMTVVVLQYLPQATASFCSLCLLHAVMVDLQGPF